MQWKIINGWYCVTACGFMSWKFRNLQEGIKWAFVSKEARDVANDNEIWGGLIMNVNQQKNLQNHAGIRQGLPSVRTAI